MRVEPAETQERRENQRLIQQLHQDYASQRLLIQDHQMNDVSNNDNLLELQQFKDLATQLNHMQVQQEEEEIQIDLKYQPEDVETQSSTNFAPESCSK